MELDEDNASKSDAQADAHQDQQAEGLSPCISWSIPRALSEEMADAPPQKLKRQIEEDLFYSLLGVCSDIVGFDERGDLLLAFDR